MSQSVLRIVKAPHTWNCVCNNRIETGEECGKIGSRVLCIKCLLDGLPKPAPRPLTKAQRLLHEARFLAFDEIADLTHFVENNNELLIDILEGDMKQIETELFLRSMPYHGGAHNLFTGLNSHQLDAMYSVYDDFYQSVKED